MKPRTPDELIDRAEQIGGHRTKKVAVVAALKERIERREQAKLVDSFGTFDYEPGYDYKAHRRRDLDAFRESLPEAPDAVPMIREDRER